MNTTTQSGSSSPTKVQRLVKPAGSKKTTTPKAAPVDPQGVVEKVQTAYPPCGSSQYITIIRTRNSKAKANPDLYLEPEEIPETVLGGYIPEGESSPARTMYVDTNLPAPNNRVYLPPFEERELRKEKVYNKWGEELGNQIRVPALHVLANQMVIHRSNETYDHERQLIRMVAEAGRLLATVIRDGIIRVRETPGVMAHLQGDTSIAPDEVGISERFASLLIKKARDVYGLPIQTVADLDNYPVLSVRFPQANEWGVQESILRILPGGGNYIAVHPWNLGARFLGDEDGDQGFILLRMQELIDGRIFKTNRPRKVANWDMGECQSQLTLAGLLDPNELKLSAKHLKKMRTPLLRTTQARLDAISDADTRGHVAVYTMAIGWWCSRILAVSGQMDPQAAHRAAYNALEWFMEHCMDARKGDSAMSGSRGGFDKYKLMDALLRGGELDFRGLKGLGIPDAALQVIRTAWQISGGRLRAYCAKDPIYDALILQRQTMEQHIPGMLLALQDMGVPPTDVYRAVVEDLTLVKGKVALPTL